MPIGQHNKIYVDESGFNLNMQREYGYAKKSKRLLADRSGKRGKRITVIAARDNKNNLVVPMYFEGYTNSEVFNLWIKDFLLPELKPNQVIIMDNASFHKLKRTRELIESVGCQLIYLPPYSPDLNPIEKKWAQVKSLYKKMTIHHEDKIRLIEECLMKNMQG